MFLKRFADRSYAHPRMHRGGGRKRPARESQPEERAHRVGRGPFGRGGGGGRVFGPGDLRLVILSLIETKPRHGYELIKELEQKFGGGYAPSPGSVYPTLTLLEELGHVRATTSEGTKRLFEITAEGAAYLRENQAALDSAVARMEMAARAFSGEAPPAELHHAMHTLKASLMFHRGGWDDKETERVRKIIETAAQNIARTG
jgi:DNA-binding PadR family transcriptional regulator